MFVKEYFIKLTKIIITRLDYYDARAILDDFGLMVEGFIRCLLFQICFRLSWAVPFTDFSLVIVTTLLTIVTWSERGTCTNEVSIILGIISLSFLWTLLIFLDIWVPIPMDLILQI